MQDLETAEFIPTYKRTKFHVAPIPQRYALHKIQKRTSEWFWKKVNARLT
jgi:hypothetical protein